MAPRHTPSAGCDGLAGIAIRPFRISDLQRVLDIERNSFPDAWDESWFIYFFQTSPEGFMVAVEGENHVVGYAIVDIEIQNTEACLQRIDRGGPSQRGHLLNIAIDRTWRRKGIGEALLDAATKYSAERGADELWLEVEKTNTNAKRFYLNRGFNETGKTIRNYYPGGGDAIVMYKKIK